MTLDRFVDMHQRLTRRLLPLAVAGATLAGCRHDAPPPDPRTRVPVLREGFEVAADTGAALPAGFAWHDRTSESIARLDTLAHGGRSSLELRQGVRDSAASLLAVVPDSAWRGATSLELDGWLRTRDVRGGWGGLVLRADGEQRVAADADPAAPRPRPLAIDLMQDAGPSGTTGWHAYTAKISIPPGTRRVVMGVVLAGTGTLWADDLVLFARRSITPPTPAALAYARAALDSMQARAFRADSTPWDSLRAALPTALAGAQTPRDTYAALRAIAERVDRHSTFVSPAEVRSIFADSDSTRLAAYRSPRHSSLPGRVGYVAIPGFVGVTTARMRRYVGDVQSALADLDAAGACGYVVDLRDNDGGNMFPMIAGLGPLLGHGRLGGFVSRRGAESGWRYENGRVIATDSSGDSTIVRATHPVTLRHSAPPVAVLIGPQTASSGEAVAASFRGRPETRFFGEPTAGLTSGNELVLMPDSAAINVTTSRLEDRTGQRFAGSIEPDERVGSGAPAAELGSDPAVQAATTWLRAQPGCRSRVRGGGSRR